MPASIDVGFRLRSTITIEISALTTITPARYTRFAMNYRPAPTSEPVETSDISAASVPQSLPPDHVSFFQIGTVDFKVSIPKRAASKASPRWGALTTTTTE